MAEGSLNLIGWISFSSFDIWLRQRAKSKKKSAGGSCLAAFSFGESPSAVSQPKNVRQAGNHAANVSIYTNERCSGVEPGRKSGRRPDKSTGRPSHGNQFLLQLFNTVVAPAKYSPNTTQSKLAAFLIDSCIRLSPFHFNGHTRPSTLCAQSWPSTIHLVITESTCENWKMPKLVVFPISLNCKLSITSTAALLLLFSILPWKRIAVPPRRSPWRRGGRDKKKIEPDPLEGTWQINFHLKRNRWRAEITDWLQQQSWRCCQVGHLFNWSAWHWSKVCGAAESRAAREQSRKFRSFTSLVERSSRSTRVWSSRHRRPDTRFSPRRKLKQLLLT